MPQTRMFRDRVVSMEQTLERGEKHLEFLKAFCKEVFPEFDYRDHTLDHERDLFLMNLDAPDGRRKTVGWTRMVLFDAERLPALLEAPASPLAIRLRDYLRERSERPEIIVTFRHLEEGWVDTPEPRRDRRRRRGRGRPQEHREGQRREGQPGRPGRHGERPQGQPGRPQGQASRPQSPAARPQGQAARPQGTPGAPAPRPAPGGERPAATAGAAPPPAGEARKRRRRFRRRRGRGGAGSPQGPAAPRTP